MAKRAPEGEKPFSAIDKTLISSVLAPPAENRDDTRPVSTATSGGNAAVAELPAGPRAPSEPRRAPVMREAKPSTVRKPAAETIEVSEAAEQDDGTEAGGLPEKLSREKRVLLTPSEDREIERCVDRIADKGLGGATVKLSHVVRACLAVVRHAEDEITRRAQSVGQLTRPPNGDAVALAEFEHELAKILSHAFRDAPALR